MCGVIDFVEDRTHDGRKYRMLNAVDEFTRECLAIRVARRLKSVDVIELLAELFMLRGAPGYGSTKKCGGAADSCGRWHLHPRCCLGGMISCR